VTLVKKALGSPVQRGVREQAKSHLIEVALHDPTFLLQCLDDSDSRVRTGALRVFYGLGHRVPESVPALQRLSENEPDNYMRSLAKDILEFQQQ
jgi:HEAT repeat protein